MAAPAVASVTVGTTNNQSSGTVNKPAGVAVGDLVVVFLVFYDNAVITASTPSGMTARGDFLESTSNFAHSYAWDRIIDGTEGASWTSNLSSGSQYIDMCAVLITGADPTSPYDTIGHTNGNATPQSFPTLTTSVNDCLLIGHKAGYNNATNSGPTSYTQQANYDTTQYVYSYAQATAGTSPTDSVGAAAADLYIHHVLAYKPSGGGAPAATILRPQPTWRRSMGIR